MEAAVLVGVFFLFLALGMPVAYSMLPAIFIVLIIYFDIPLSMVAVSMEYAVDAWIWLTFPLFMLLGNLMNETGITDALINFCQELFGRFHGALSHVTVAANILMAGMSGSNSADAAATGVVLIPAMKKAGYPKGYASMIVCGSSLIGPMIPPSLALIMIAVLGNLSVLRLWIGGAVPGLILGAALLIVGYIIAKRRGFPRVESPFSFQKVTVSGLKAVPALILPIVILGGMRIGIFTPTEAGAVAVVYAIFLGIFVYKKLHFSTLVDVARRTIPVLCPVMFIIAVAIAFGQVAGLLKLGEAITKFTIGLTSNSLVFLILVSLLMLFLGCLMESAVIRLIFYPLLFPVANAYGIDPIHFGVLFGYLTLVGQSTPPVGPTMFITNAIAGCTIKEYLRDGWPLLVAQFAVVPIFIFFPSTITFLPDLVMGKSL